MLELENPRRESARRAIRLLFRCSFVAALVWIYSPFVPSAVGQERVPREVRTYIPPDQIVSFQPTTSFSRFIELLNPVFQNVTGKQIVDPEQRQFPIGITVAGLHFFDAFELVLEYHGLTFRETDSFFILEEPPSQSELIAQQAGTLRPGMAAAAQVQQLATHDTREVQIDALIFQIDHTRTRQLGIDWNVLFPPIGGQQGGQSGGQRQQDERIPQIRVRTNRFMDRFDEYLITPNEVDLAFVTNLLRLLESMGAGETLAQPSVTVQSNQEGRIQIGSDIPVTVRDFAGNTITQFVSTGIIVHVVPTLVERDEDAQNGQNFDFIHLNVQVENSSGRPFGEAVAIDRSTANTQVLLLDGEQTIIGGLYSVSRDTERRGIPLLKDLPPWFFGLRYIFGFERKTQSQQELLIVLKAHLLDPLNVRSARPLRRDQLEQFRGRVDQMLESVDEQLLERMGASPRLREPRD